MRNLINLASIILFSLSATVSANDQIEVAEVFKKMKSLVGIWKKEGENNSKFKISFELTANDTTLIETWIYEEKKYSLTLYHLNGENLMATHYCPQGNQPRLHLSGSSTLNSVSFTYLDATNLKSIKDSHQHSLGFDLSKSSNRIHRKETYLSKVGEEASELVLVRK